MSFPGILLLMVGCSIIGGDDDDDDEPVPETRFYVTAEVLNVRANPSNTSDVIAQARRGTIVVPTHESGAWYGVPMTDKSTGWVHQDFLSLCSTASPYCNR